MFAYSDRAGDVLRARLVSAREDRIVAHPSAANSVDRFPRQREIRPVKALAIDFGEKRVGLAISDVEGRFAMPWKSLERRSDRQVIRELIALAKEESVELIVIGEPRRLDGAAGEQAQRVAGFSRKLASSIGLPIETVNESLTSREAEERLRAAGLNPRQRRQQIDSVAAQILLQEVLDRRRRPA